MLRLMEKDKVPQVATIHQSLQCLPNSEPRDGFFNPSLTYMIYAYIYFLCLGLCVLGNDALISWGSLMQAKHLSCVLIHI